MAKEDQIVEALSTIKSSIRHIRRRSMRLGRYTNGVLDTAVNATLPAAYVWVFDPQGDKRVSSPAKNLTTEYGVGMSVIVAYNVDSQEDDVIGVDTVLAPLEQGSAAAGLNSPQKGANTPTPINARDITVGGVFAASSGGLDVRIGAFWHENGYYADSAVLTLTPTATSGKKSFAVVGVNRLTNAATFMLTADRSVGFTLITNDKPNPYAVADIMAVVDAAPQTDWRGAVELKNGDTTINPAKILPLPWLKPAMVGADGSAAGERGLVPAPAATDNDKALLGAGAWAFRHLTSTTSTTVTLASGAATIPATTCFVILAAETGTADDLDTATVTGAPRIILFQADSGDTITVKHSTGNIELNGATDFALSGDKTLALFWDGTNLADIGAGGGGGSFTGDAFDVPYTPTTSGDWSSVPAEVGEALDTLAADVAGVSGGGATITVNTYATTRPSSPASGDLYIPTDGYWSQEVYDGANWRPQHAGALLTVPPSAGWSWDNQGSSTIDSSLGGLYLCVPAGTSSLTLRCRYRAAPTAPYTITALIEPNMLGITNSYVSIGFRENSSGKLHALLAGLNAVNLQVYSAKYTSAAAYSANYTSTQQWKWPTWLRIKDDNTNRICQLSRDGKTWLTLHSVSRTDFLTADQVYFGVAPASATFDSAMTILSWEVT